MKRTPLKRKSPLRAKHPAKRAKRPLGASKRIKRTKLPKLSTMRNKCDNLLTPIIKARHPNCEACGAQTQVGHHWIEKSRSAYLRYDLRNIIPLCHSCHAKIHNRFGNSIVGGLDVAEIIISKRGREWKEQLDIDQSKYQKVDRVFYDSNLGRLSAFM